MIFLFCFDQKHALTHSNTNTFNIPFNPLKTNETKKKINHRWTSSFVIAVPFRGPPRYNPRRRSGIGWTTTTIYPQPPSIYASSHYNQHHSDSIPPSPCPSEHPFSSASSSLSEGSTSNRSHEDDISIVTGIQIIAQPNKNKQTKLKTTHKPNTKYNSKIHKTSAFGKKEEKKNF